MTTHKNDFPKNAHSHSKKASLILGYPEDIITHPEWGSEGSPKDIFRRNNQSARMR